GHDPGGDVMSSVLEQLFNSPVGQLLAKQAGLQQPPKLRRGRTMPKGPVVLAELPGADGTTRATLELLGIETSAPLMDVAENRTGDDGGRKVPGPYTTALGSVVVDATGVRTIPELEGIRQALRPAVRGLERSGRIIIVATDASAVEGLEAHAVAQAI